jgi:hypothetical protein
MDISQVRKRNRAWIWVFVTMFGLAIIGSVVLIRFNQEQQLNPEQLEAAHKVWREKGPADYTITYKIKRNEEPEDDHYEVTVRGGKVVASKYNGRDEEPRLFLYRGMEALFQNVERFMREDSEKGRPKTFVRALFDEKNGAIVWYVRRVMGSRQREEITVEGFTKDKP